MKRYASLPLIIAITACSTPALQTDIFSKSTPDMKKVESECANTTAHKNNKHVTAINCRFDAYEVILGERGFQEYNDLDALKGQFLYIAKKQDAHKISDAKAHALFEEYTQEFYDKLQHHDNVKAQAYELQKAQTLAVIGAIAGGLSDGLQAYSAARYPVNSPPNQAPCPACDQGVQQSQQFIQQQQAQQQQQQQQQNAEALQQQIQQQQNEINRLNNRSPIEKLHDCAQAGNCAGAFAPPSSQDVYGSYGSVPQSR
jgi:hypothetical protein